MEDENVSVPLAVRQNQLFEQMRVLAQNSERTQQMMQYQMEQNEQLAQRVAELQAQNAALHQSRAASPPVPSPAVQPVAVPVSVVLLSPPRRSVRRALLPRTRSTVRG